MIIPPGDNKFSRCGKTKNKQAKLVKYFDFHTGRMKTAAQRNGTAGASTTVTAGGTATAARRKVSDLADAADLIVSLKGFADQMKLNLSKKRLQLQSKITAHVQTLYRDDQYVFSVPLSKETTALLYQFTNQQPLSPLLFKKSKGTFRKVAARESSANAYDKLRYNKSDQAVMACVRFSVCASSSGSNELFAVANDAILECLAILSDRCCFATPSQYAEFSGSKWPSWILNKPIVSSGQLICGLLEIRLYDLYLRHQQGFHTASQQSVALESLSLLQRTSILSPQYSNTIARMALQTTSQDILQNKDLDKLRLIQRLTASSPHVHLSNNESMLKIWFISFILSESSNGSSNNCSSLSGDQLGPHVNSELTLLHFISIPVVELATPKHEWKAAFCKRILEFTSDVDCVRIVKEFQVGNASLIRKNSAKSSVKKTKKVSNEKRASGHDVADTESPQMESANESKMQSSSSAVDVNIGIRRNNLTEKQIDQSAKNIMVGQLVESIVDTIMDGLADVAIEITDDYSSQEQAGVKENPSTTKSIRRDLEIITTPDEVGANNSSVGVIGNALNLDKSAIDKSNSNHSCTDNSCNFATEAAPSPLPSPSHSKREQPNQGDDRMSMFLNTTSSNTDRANPSGEESIQVASVESGEGFERLLSSPISRDFGGLWAHFDFDQLPSDAYQDSSVSFFSTQQLSPPRPSSSGNQRKRLSTGSSSSGEASSLLHEPFNEEQWQSLTSSDIAATAYSKRAVFFTTNNYYYMLPQPAASSESPARAAPAEEDQAQHDNRDGHSPATASGGGGGIGAEFTISPSSSHLSFRDDDEVLAVATNGVVFGIVNDFEGNTPEGSAVHNPPLYSGPSVASSGSGHIIIASISNPVHTIDNIAKAVAEQAAVPVPESPAVVARLAALNRENLVLGIRCLRSETVRSILTNQDAVNRSIILGLHGDDSAGQYFVGGGVGGLAAIAEDLGPSSHHSLQQMQFAAHPGMGVPFADRGNLSFTGYGSSQHSGGVGFPQRNGIVHNNLANIEVQSEDGDRDYNPVRTQSLRRGTLDGAMGPPNWLSSLGSDPAGSSSTSSPTAYNSTSNTGSSSRYPYGQSMDALLPLKPLQTLPATRASSSNTFMMAHSAPSSSFHGPLAPIPTLDLAVGASNISPSASISPGRSKSPPPPANITPPPSHNNVSTSPMDQDIEGSSFTDLEAKESSGSDQPSQLQTLHAAAVAHTSNTSTSPGPPFRPLIRANSMRRGLSAGSMPGPLGTATAKALSSKHPVVC
jgi:hypothetical protein